MTAKTEATQRDGPYDPEALPDVVVRYLDARDDQRYDDAAACFADDATVLDEGRTYSGPAEIARWIQDSSTEWTYTSSRLGQLVNSSDVQVVVRIDGDFPGGTATLRFVFALHGGKIARLHIAP